MPQNYKERKEFKEMLRAGKYLVLLVCHLLRSVLYMYVD